MAQATARGFVPVPGSWASIGLIYLYGVLSTASLTKIIPVLGDVGAQFGASPGQVAILISLMTVLPALLASVAGSLIDRIGAHRALQLVALTGMAVNFAYVNATTLAGFMAVRVFEGLLAVGAYSAAPALIMATTSVQRRGTTMALWSTYSPVGASLGLVLSGSFAGTPDWRGGYWLHLALYGVLVATMWMLPRAPAVLAGRLQPRALFAAWTQSGPLRLAFTFSMLVVIGFGMATIYPEWYARQQQVPVGQASNILALANLVMIPGGFLAGALLARGWRDGSLVTALLLAAVAFAWPVFMPGLGDALRLLGVGGWMLAQGALIAVVMATLPHVVADPRQGAAAAGLVSQLAAMITFVTPLVWQPILQSGAWLGFVGVTAAAASLAWLLFPRRPR